MALKNHPTILCSKCTNANRRADKKNRSAGIWAHYYTYSGKDREFVACGKTIRRRIGVLGEGWDHTCERKCPGCSERVTSERMTNNMQLQ